MADNILVTAGSGTTVAADDIGGVLHQRVKISQGADGSGTDVSSAAPLQVTLANTGANATSVKVDGSAATQPVSGSVTATQATGTNLHTVVDSGTVTTVSTVTNLSQLGGTAVSMNTGTRSAGTQRVTIATDDVVPVTDNGGSLTVDYATTGSGTATGALRVELPTNGTGVIATVGAVTAITNALPAGTNAIGKLSANSGVDIGDVDVTTVGTVTPGTAATSLGKAEDAAHASGDVGVMSLGVRNDAGTVLAGTDGDYLPFSMDASGAVRVTGGGGGTQYVEDAASAGGETMTLAGAVRQDTIASNTSADGDYSYLKTTASGRLYTSSAVETVNGVAPAFGTGTRSASTQRVTIATDDSVPVTMTSTAISSVIPGAGNTNLGATVDAAAGSTKVGVLAVGVRDDVLATLTPVDNDYTEGLRVDSTGAQWVHATAVDSVVPGTSAANLGKAEDAAHTTGDTGVYVLGVRQDADTSPVSADGDYHGLIFNAIGRAKVSALPAATATTTGNITASGNTVPADTSRQSGVTVQVTGTFGGLNMVFEASIDGGTTYNAVQAARSSSNTVETSSGVISANPGYFWRIAAFNATNVRVRATAIASGTAVVLMMPTAFASDPAPVSQTPAASPIGGYTPGKLISAASTNATNVKNAAGTIGYVTASNVNAAARYLKIYNKASAPAVGTDIPVHTFIVPGNTAGAGTNIPLPPQGINCSTGISFALTTGIADADTGAVALNELAVNYGYL